MSKVSLEALPSLNVLKVDRCDSGVLRCMVHVASLVTKLEIESNSGWIGVIEYLGAVENLTIRKCNEIRCLKESEASNVLGNLRKLTLWDCDNMEFCACPDNIEVLRMWICASVTVISTRGQKLKVLSIHECDRLLETEWGRQKVSNISSMPMLEHAMIKCWKSLKSVIELSYLAHLRELRIESCESLESFPDNELPNMTSLIFMIIKDCPSLDASFPRGFWPPKLQSLSIGNLKKPISKWRSQNFPASLAHLCL